MKIGYENTDKKIEVEIYGLKFELNNIEKLKDYENVEDNDLDGIKKILETILGENSVKKINEQRKKDGYKEMDNEIAINILANLSNVYMQEYQNKVFKPLTETYNNINNFNKNIRRYNKRNRGKYGRY